MKEKKKEKKTSSEPNPEEFSWGFNSYISGKHHHSVTQHSRKEKLTECRVTIKDKITGEEEHYTIPAGNYSKKEMQKLRGETLQKGMLSLFKKRK